MAKKKTSKVDLDDYGFGSDDDFDFDSEFNFEAEPPKKDRNPATVAVGAAVGSLKSGAIEQMTDPYWLRSKLDESMPDGFRQTAGVYDKASSELGKLYNDSAKAFKPVIKDARRVTKKMLPTAQKYLPKGLAAKVEKFANKDEGAYQAMGADQQKEMAITAELGNIFTRGQVQAEQIAQNQEARDTIRDTMDHQRHQDTQGVLTEINKSMSALVGYQDDVTYKWQKKSLELQLRTYGVLTETLKFNQENNAKLLTNLEMVVKNTALPEYVKLQSSEALKQQARNQLISAATGGLFANRDKFIGKLFGNMRKDLTQKVQDAAGQIHGLIQGADGFIDSMSMMEDVPPEEMIGMMLGGEAASWLVRKAGTKVFAQLKKRLEGDTPDARKVKALLQDLKYAINNAPETVNSIIEKLGYGSAIGNFISNNLPSARVESGLDHDKATDIIEVGMYSKVTDKTIREIIPGYLSRILREVQVFRTGNEKIELTEYDFTRNSFNSRSGVISSLKSKLVTESDKADFDQSTQDLMKKTGFDQKLSPEAQRSLAKSLLKSKAAGKNLSPKDLLSEYTYRDMDPAQRKEVVEAMRGYFKLNDSDEFDDKDYDNKFKKNVISDGVMNLGKYIQDKRSFAQTMIANGQGAMLKDMGLMNDSGNYDYDTHIDFIANDARTPMDQRNGEMMYGYDRSTLAKRQAEIRNIDPDFPAEQVDPDVAKGIIGKFTKIKERLLNWYNTSQTSPDAGKVSKMVTTAVSNLTKSSSVKKAVKAALVALLLGGAGMANAATGGAISGADFIGPLLVGGAAAGAAAPSLMNRIRNLTNRNAQQNTVMPENPNMVNGTPANINTAIAQQNSANNYTEGSTTLVGTNKSLADLLIEHSVKTLNVSMDATLKRIEANLLSGVAINGIAGGLTAQNIRNLPWYKMSIGDMTKAGVDGAGKLITTTARGIASYSKKAMLFSSKQGKKALGFAWDKAIQLKDSAVNMGRAAIGKVEKFADVHIRGLDGKLKTVITAARMKAGEYSITDKNGNKIPLTDLKQLVGYSGDVVSNISGEVVLQASQLKDILIGNQFLKKTWRAIVEGAKKIKDFSFGLMKGVYGQGINLAMNVLLPKAKQLAQWSMKNVQDVYIPSQPATPKLLARVLAEGGYTSATTGKVIKSINEIDGAIKETSTGNVVLTLDEMAQGLFDQHGFPIAKTRIGKLVNKAKAMLRWSIGQVKKGVEKVKNFATGAIGHLFGGISDSFNFQLNFNRSSKTTNTLLFHIRNMLNDRLPGERTEFDDKDLMTGSGESLLGKLGGKIKSKLGNLKRKVSDKFLNFRTMLGGKVGGAIASLPGFGDDGSGGSQGGGMMSKLGGLLSKIPGASKVGAAIGPYAKATVNSLKTKQGRDELRAYMGEELGNAVRNFDFKGKIKGLAGKLTNARAIKTPMEFIGGVIQNTRDAIGNGLINLQKAINELKGDAPVAGDADGDGVRDGSISDQRNREGDEEELDENGNPTGRRRRGRFGRFLKRFGRKGRGLAGRGITKLGNLTSKIPGMGRVGGLLTRGGTMVAGAAGAAEVGGVVAGAGAAGGTAAAAGGAAGGAAAAAGGTALLPWLVGAAAVGAVGYGLYKGFKVMTRKKQTSLNRIRMAQYGFKADQKADIQKVFEIEEVLAKKVSQDGSSVPIDAKDSTEITNIADIVSMWSKFKKFFGANVSSTQGAEFSNFKKWFDETLKPVFLEHWRAALKVKGKISSLDDVEKFSGEQKWSYLQAIKKIKSGMFTQNPFDSGESIEVSPAYLKKTIDIAEEELSKFAKGNELDSLEGAEKDGMVTKIGKFATNWMGPMVALKAGNQALQWMSGGRLGSKKTIDIDFFKSKLFDGDFHDFDKDHEISAKLTEMRMYAYGLTSLESAKVEAIKKLETYIESEMINEDGVAKFKGKFEDILKEVGSEFNITKATDPGAMPLSKWLQFRFLPVFLEFCGGVYSMANRDLVALGIKLLKPAGYYKIAKAMMGAKTKKGDLIWEQVEFTPWNGYKLGSDASVVSALMEYFTAEASKQKASEDAAKTKQSQVRPPAAATKKATPAKSAAPSAPPPPAATPNAKGPTINQSGSTAPYVDPNGQNTVEEGVSPGSSGAFTQAAKQGAAATGSTLSGPVPVASAPGGLNDGKDGDKWIKLKDSGARMTGVHPAIAAAFRGMVTEYGLKTGKKVQLDSGYRSTAEQAELYRRLPKGRAAPPGRSAHEWGLALDISSADADGLEKAGLLAKYGFVRPVPGEAWHIEPLGMARVGKDYISTKYGSQQWLDLGNNATNVSWGKGGGGIGALGKAGKGQGRKTEELLARLKGAPPKMNYVNVDSNIDPMGNTGAPKPATGAQSSQPSSGGGGYAGSVSATKQSGAASAAIAQNINANGMMNADSPSGSGGSASARPAKPVKAGKAIAAGAIGTGGSQGQYPAPTSSDGRGFKPLFEYVGKKFGVPAKYLAATAAKESGFRPDVTADGDNGNPNSKSAAGIFQFIPSTWGEMFPKAVKHGADPNATRLDPVANTIAGALYMKQMANSGPTDPVSIYFKHLLGPSGGAKFLTALKRNPNDSSATAVSGSAINSNPGIFAQGGKKGAPTVTLGQAYSTVVKQFGDRYREYGLDSLYGPLNATTTAAMPAGGLPDETGVRASDGSQMMSNSQTAAALSPARRTVGVDATGGSNASPSNTGAASSNSVGSAVVSPTTPVTASAGYDPAVQPQINDNKSEVRIQTQALENIASQQLAALKQQVELLSKQLAVTTELKEFTMKGKATTGGFSDPKTGKTAIFESGYRPPVQGVLSTMAAKQATPAVPTRRSTI